MVKGFGEIALLILMAAVTEVRLFFSQQRLRLGRVDAVTINARHAGCSVLAAIEMHLVRAFRMAVQTNTEHFAGLDLSQARNLASVSSTIDVRRTRPMADFAAFRPSLFVCTKYSVMRSRLHHASLIRMTDFALLAADILGSRSG
jgi:hypothetical protein